jgi:hypothetical protein
MNGKYKILLILIKKILSFFGIKYKNNY